MSDAIQSARRLLQERIAEIDLEAAELRSAVESIGGPRGGEASPAKPKRRRAKRVTKRAPRGQRREQFLSALREKPKSKIAEIAKEIGVSPNQAHGLARGLLKDGAISKRSGKYSVIKTAK